MTRQESFKRRVRARMAKTGERYGAARRVLIDQATARRPWAADPDVSDDAVREATGRRWDEWRALIDAWPGRDDGHSAVAAHVEETYGVDGWWAQAVTVGWERISGRRRPHQQPDGTFTAGKSRTITADAAALKALLLDNADRADLFPGLETALRSRPSSKVVRLSVGPGTAQIALDELPDGRVKVSVAHERLPEPDDVDLWKAYWAEWLEALDEA